MKILMVCLGNICRSPLAEGIMRSKLPDHFTVDSAGTIGKHAGEKPDHRSVKTAANYKLDISAQQSRPFTADDFEEFDLIYCMDRYNYRDVLAKARSVEHRNKVKLIMDELDSHKGKDVPDPYYGEMQHFDEVYRMLDQACAAAATRILNS